MGLEPTWSQTQSPSSASTGLQLQDGQDLHQLVGELFGRHLRCLEGPFFVRAPSVKHRNPCKPTMILETHDDFKGKTIDFRCYVRLLEGNPYAMLGYRIVSNFEPTPLYDSIATSGTNTPIHKRLEA